MKDCRQFYIDGKWVAPATRHDFPVINPSTEEPIAQISLGSATDVGKAVSAAKSAFETFSETSVAERLALLRRVIEIYQVKHERDGRGHLIRDGRSDLVIASGAGSSWFTAPDGNSEGAGEISVRGIEGFNSHAEGSGRSVRAHYALELADESSRLQSGAGAGGRLHDGTETE